MILYCCTIDREVKTKPRTSPTNATFASKHANYHARGQGRRELEALGSGAATTAQWYTPHEAMYSSSSEPLAAVVASHDSK